jgi:small subunit ribosomal protein S3
MGHKAHPLGFRLGISKDWKAKWYAEDKYKERALEDVKIRKLIQEKAKTAGIAAVEIERSLTELTITLRAAKPGLVIGRGGKSIEELKKELVRLTGLKINLNIEEVKKPQLSARLVAEGIADQIERRYPPRRAISSAAERVMEAGAKGVKIVVSGRLGGTTNIARAERVTRGSVPLQTLRADVDFAREVAHAGPKGSIGVKVWIYRGEKEV